MYALLWLYNVIPSSSIVNKLNIMSYNSTCTIRTITVAVVHSMYSQSVREPACGAEDYEYYNLKHYKVPNYITSLLKNTSTVK